MKDKIIQILISLAHISKQMQTLSEQLDKLYDTIGDQAFLDLIKNETEK